MASSSASAIDSADSHLSCQPVKPSETAGSSPYGLGSSLSNQEFRTMSDLYNEGDRTHTFPFPDSRFFGVIFDAVR
jgi:hypothetical protein